MTRGGLLRALLAGALVVSCSALFEAPWAPNEASLKSWMEEGGVPLRGDEAIPELRSKVLRRLQDVATLFMSQSSDMHELMHFMDSTVVRALEAVHGGDVSAAAGSALRAAVTSLMKQTGKVPTRLEAAHAARSALNSTTSGFHPFGLHPFPYFGFLPQYVGSVLPGDANGVEWEAPCFRKNRAQLDASQDGGRTVTLRFSRSDATSLLCADHYLLSTLQGVWTTTFFWSGSSSLPWRVQGSTPALQWDLEAKGIRIFRFRDGIIQTVIDLLDTVALFIPAQTEASISPAVAQRNLYFMEHYASQPMRPRAVPDVDIDESLVHSGDFFGVVRLDGLDPMLAWAMGSTTGHTTVALRIDGELYVTESTVTDSHWPTNGIQKTPFKVWMQQAKAASYQVVWAPLSAEARARFNETAAVEFFRTVEGLDYGYRTLLYGWLDTLKDNYPCLPPDFSHCLSWELFELVYGMLDVVSPPTADMLFGQAYNLRVGTWGLRAPELLQEASRRGIHGAQLPVLVEQDSFRYNTTKNGKPIMDRSMVCCVFVCNIWKAGGVFAGIQDEVNCGELTNWDDYALDVLDKAPNRPEQCKQADPDNNLCQLRGEYTLVLNDFATKSPYAHMAERCPSHPPEYKKPADC